MKIYIGRDMDIKWFSTLSVVELKKTYLSKVLLRDRDDAIVEPSRNRCGEFWWHQLWRKPDAMRTQLNQAAECLWIVRWSTYLLSGDDCKTSPWPRSKLSHVRFNSLAVLSAIFTKVSPIIRLFSSGFTVRHKAMVCRPWTVVEAS